MADVNWPTGMMVIQGNHLEELRDVMTGWIQRYPLSPLEDEQILVQSNGIAQWLKMALAENEDKGGCGIAAAMKVQLPGRFIWQAYRCFEPDIPSASPFDKGPLTWTLYQLLSDQATLQASIPNPDCLSPLLGFLQKDADPRRVYQLAAKLSDIYDQYQVYRADWLEAWEASRDVLIRAGQESELPLSEEQLWQPALWRLISDTIRQQPLKATLSEQEGFWAKKSRSEIHRIIVEQARQQRSAPDDLPKRVIVFGISALPQQNLELLQSLSHFCQVLLFVHNPSPHYWGDLIEGRALLKQYTRTKERKIPEGISLESLHLQGNPLLASWGKQGRDYLHLLDENDQPESYREHFNRIDLFEPPHPDNQGRMSLLHQVQDDIYQLRSLDERREQSRSGEYQIDPSHDNSLQFIVAHSPQREVEILHDQLLDAFEQARKRGELLQPRDILVMVPDVSVYAPHVQAVFGRYTPSAGAAETREYLPRDNRFIPYYISDQGQRGVNSLLTAFESLLQLRDARFAVSELLDLLDTPALQNRFGFSEEHLPKLHQWIKGANIRWGLDQQHRSELDLPEAGEQNSWLFGLKRMLLGYAVGQSDPWHEIEPYDEIAGLEAALIGPLVLLIDALQLSRQEMLTPRAPRDWEYMMNGLCHRFFTADTPSDERAISTISKGMETWCQECELGQLLHEPLPLEVVREELLSRIDQPTLTQKFLGGSVNFATLMPMRAIPFKQVWLLGMNDADYPRSQQAADFDLMANDYRPGDRSRREDDRYLFLEALLSARERLVISWVGRNIRDNSEKPPSVLVGQLRDYLAAGWSLAGQPDEKGAGSLLDAITTEHPLQPFSKQYFMSDDKAEDSPAADNSLFTYAKEWRDVHEQMPLGDTQASGSDQGLISGEETLPPLKLDAPLTLTDLAGFLRHPVKTFFSRRLGVNWFDRGEVAEDEEHFALDGLERWALQKTLIDRVVQEQAKFPDIPADELLELALNSLRMAGELPMAAFADAEVIRLKDALYEPLSLYQALRQQYPTPDSSSVRVFGLSTGDQLEAQLNDLRCNADGETIRLVLQPSRLFRGDDLKYEHLIRHWPYHLFAQLERPVITHLLGADSEQTIQMQPIPPEQAEAILLDLAEAWLENINQLWPLACKTGFSHLTDGDPEGQYMGGFRHTGECGEHPAYSRFWSDFQSLAADGRFQTLAERLYAPMLASLKPIAGDQI